ncbi:Alpha-glucosidase [Hondaea fermentalgiana]|uniref:Alpha-glucosidase n=1 Tax=Hondaea fermentalgiana TaxID=2315210 RepID=A0A2R5G1X4_9STRA|nr:Alpha-glucosidase [Hondaea fermentalgiana]|eukprot:GBG24992.1 Alpha-glucosidase [Hondaea fermentalgiana]
MGAARAGGPHYTVCLGMAWHGTARHAAGCEAWHGMAWHGMARHGVARCDAMRCLGTVVLRESPKTKSTKSETPPVKDDEEKEGEGAAEGEDAVAAAEQSSGSMASLRSLAAAACAASAALCFGGGLLDHIFVLHTMVGLTVYPHEAIEMVSISSVLAVTMLFVSAVLSAGLIASHAFKLAGTISTTGLCAGVLASIAVDPDFTLSLDAIRMSTACMGLSCALLAAAAAPQSKRADRNEDQGGNRDASHNYAAVVLAIGILAFVFQTSASDAQCFAQLQTPSDLEIRVESTTLELGAFQLQVDAARGTLELTAGPARRSVFANLPSEAFFVGARQGSFAAPNDEEMGLYAFQDLAHDLSVRQTIDAIERSTDLTVSVRGVLVFAHSQQSNGDKGTKGRVGVAASAEIPYEFRLEASGSDHISFSAQALASESEVNGSAHGSPLRRAYIRHQSSAAESVYGFGIQYSYMDMKGGCVPIFTQEQGIGRGLQPISYLVNFFVKRAAGSWQTSYAPAPFYLTSAMRSMYLSTTDFALFDLTRPDAITVEVNASSVKGAFVVRSSPLKIIETYTREHAGRMRPLPDWVGNGAILGLQGGTEKVRNHVATLKAAHVPLAALWLQDWTGKRETDFGRRLQWNWEVSHAHYPGWDLLLRELADDKIYVLSYINAYLANTGGASNESVTLYQEALAENCLIKNADGHSVQIQASATPDFTFATIDLTNPRCQDWYVDQVILKRMFRASDSFNNVHGVLGFMADFAESLPLDATLHSGDASSMHNEFPVLWAKTCRKAIEANEFLAENAVFFMRAAGGRSPGASTLMWMGDQMTTFDHHDGMRSALTGVLSAGFSGFSLSHSDIGGYTMFDRFGVIRVKRSPELFMRWAEMNVFSDAIFRTHEGVLPDISAQAVDPEVIDHFARFARLHRELFALVKKPLMQLAYRTGAPLARHLFLEFPHDPRARKAHDQFLLGSNLLVCPVFSANKFSRPCYIPEGNWTHVFTGENPAPHSTFECAAPLGKPCVLHLPEAAHVAKTIREVLA